MRGVLLEGVHASWKCDIEAFLSSDKGAELLERLRVCQASAQTFFPPALRVFEAFKLCPIDKVRVVIIGQDPYHNENQANGLAFSVSPSYAKKLPPSLVRILREAGDPNTSNGDLSQWATQGVFLLNTVLTVAAHKPGSHYSWGWERFTDSVISRISARSGPRVVFLLWGNKARTKLKLIDQAKHAVILTSHPSPLSTKGNFVGSKCFDKANALLQEDGQLAIDWIRILP